MSVPSNYLHQEVTFLGMFTYLSVCLSVCPFVFMINPKVTDVTEIFDVGKD